MRVCNISSQFDSEPASLIKMVDSKLIVGFSDNLDLFLFSIYMCKYSLSMKGDKTGMIKPPPLY